ncbi:MAG: dehalogenase [Dehalococcoides mccartyi]|uniref:dehalogenase n=1 Tax=Dehalococcoides mccartyi TaxID=61435 RepID=UPI000804FFE9|nr:dehalogenase [Dehalococcoides mccartyi]OBW62902.1 MAG: dehalogenase [Dehalococcoides mccartyi]
MWLLLGILIGIIALGIIWWASKSNTSLQWYDWVIGLAGLAMLLFTVQNYFASVAEGESKVASMFLLVAGLPALILLAVVWQLVIRRVKKA